MNDEALTAPKEPPPPYDEESFLPAPDSVGSIAAESSVSPEMDAPYSEPVSSVIQKLVPSPVRFDMASGRVRYFGPTTNMTVMSRASSSKGPEQKEAHWPICLVVQDLSPETHSYLMDLYWKCHNPIIPLVHLHAFYQEKDQGLSTFYSTFLHLAMLATGFRYADKTRPDIQRLGLAGCTSSTLYEKAKAMSKFEMERSGGIPAIQGFLLLGTLAFMSGDDVSGWLHTG